MRNQELFDTLCELAKTSAYLAETIDSLQTSLARQRERMGAGQPCDKSAVIDSLNASYKAAVNQQLVLVKQAVHLEVPPDVLHRSLLGVQPSPGTPLVEYNSEENEDETVDAEDIDAVEDEEDFLQ